MINQLEENLEKFKPSEMWKPSYYKWLLDFLDVEDNRKLFFWVEGEELMITNANPPKYYGKFKFYIHSKFPSFFKFKNLKIVSLSKIKVGRGSIHSVK